MWPLPDHRHEMRVSGALKKFAGKNFFDRHCTTECVVLVRRESEAICAWTGELNSLLKGKLLKLQGAQLRLPMSFA